MTTGNIHQDELEKFEKLSSDWWDRDGQLRTLHDINPLRLDYITARIALAGQKVLDIGCGGGILCEGLARLKARVTGIDISPGAIETAIQHGRISNLDIRYDLATAEEYAGKYAGAFDIITCMELLEHVAEPEPVISSCAKLVRPGGHLFFSTINRTPGAWLFAVLAAEHIFNIIPAGTHDYSRFIRPSELARLCRQYSLDVCDITGVTYVPYARNCYLTKQPAINYLMYARPASPDND